MNSLPYTTKILIGLLIVVSVNFVWTLTGSSSTVQTVASKGAPSKQKITAPPMEQIYTCEQYKQKIRSCTSQAMVCLESIGKSKQFHEENQQKIINCQNQNQKNLLINKELRVKLDAVTERLDQLVNKRSASADNTAGNTKTAEL